MKNKYTESVIKAGEWFVKTQNKDCNSANFGRFIYARNLESGFETPSTGWQTAFGVFAMLSLHKLTGDDKYLESATNGMSYIKTLQILDSRKKDVWERYWKKHPRANGCIRVMLYHQLGQCLVIILMSKTKIISNVPSFLLTGCWNTL